MNQFFGPKQQDAGTGTQSTGVPAFADRHIRSEIATYREVPNLVAPIWPTDSAVDINIYVSSSAVTPNFRKLPSEALVLEERNFTLGNYSDTREIDTTITVPKEVQNNGTLWAHFLVGLTGSQLDPLAKGYNTEKAVHFLRPLNQYLPKKKAKKLKNLLSSPDEPEYDVDDTPDIQLASYYHPNFTVSLIPDSGTFKYSQLQYPIQQHVQLETTGARDSSGQNGWYYPIAFLNTFWQLRSHMTELNSTVKTLPLRITLNNQQHWKFSVMASFDESTKQASRQAALGGQTPGGGDGSEFEMLKEILLDTNIWLLGTTVVVTILHMLFETLAFKNDIVSETLNYYICVICIIWLTRTPFDSLTGARRKTLWGRLFAQSWQTSSCKRLSSCTWQITARTLLG